MEFDYKEDMEGLIRGIAEEVSYANHDPEITNEDNWSEAEDILGSNYLRFLDRRMGGMISKEDKKVLKFTHELIAAKARRLYEKNPSSGPVVNWLTAQKDLAVEVYLMNVGCIEREANIKMLEEKIQSELDPLKKYQGI